MPTTPPDSFANLLRRQRLAAGLTQEALAERARLSREAVSALERGERQRPRPDTVELLAEALGLDDAGRADLVAAARPARTRLDAPAPALVGAGSGEAAPTALGSHAALHVSASHLPTPPTPLLGRAAELAGACDLLVRERARLVTLLGPGGVGKTRLAIEVAAECREAFADGVVFAPLGSLGDPALLAATLARAVGAPGDGNRPPEEALAAHLGSRQILLVLDNFEHLLPAAPLLAELLAICPRVAVLVTSRSLLRLRGERVLAVPPLATPDATSSSSVEALAAAPAIALFVARARAVRPEFALTPDNAPVVAAICRRLDGLPLAIELATARVALLPPRALLARLERRLPTLVGGARDLPDRQRTMRDALAWSYDLLAPTEQVLLRRLSVFAGGATLDAVESVSCPDTPSDLDRWETLVALVDHSLARREEAVAGEPRIGMLETIREYALEQLAASGEQDVVERAHALYYLRLAETAEPALRGADQDAWLQRLEAEIDNLRAALRWAAAHPRTAAPLPVSPRYPSPDRLPAAADAPIGLRLAAALWPFWWARGYLSEGRSWLDAFLADEDALAPTSADEPMTPTMPPSSRARARALLGAGILAAEQADYGRATPLLEESLALCRAAGESARIAEVLTTLGTIARDQGEFGRAASLLGESLEILRALDDLPRVAATLGHLGEVARYRGDLDQAAALHDESFTTLRALGDKQGMATSLLNQGLVAFDRGDQRRALALHQESLGLFQALGDRVGVAWTLEGIAVVIGALGQPTRAARLLGAASALRELIGAPLPPAARVGHERVVASARAALGPRAFDAAWAEGGALPSEQAVELALGPS